MFQLRIYTLRSPEALQQYATVHWARHLTTLKTFGVTTHGVWTERSDSANRLVALIRYPPRADPEQLTRQCMTSPQFAADMARSRRDRRRSVGAARPDGILPDSLTKPQECST